MEKIFTFVDNQWRWSVPNLVFPDVHVPLRPHNHAVPHPILEGGMGKYPVEAVVRMAQLFAKCWRWHDFEAWLPHLQFQVVAMLNSVNRTEVAVNDNLQGGSKGLGVPVWLNNLVPVVAVCFLISAKLNDDETHPLPRNINLRVYETLRAFAIWPELDSVATLNMAEAAVVRALVHSWPSSSPSSGASRCSGASALPQAPPQGCPQAAASPRSQ